MAAITFKAKVESVYNMDDTLAYRLVRVPVLARRHCDMPAWRNHPKYGGLANSDLLVNILARVRRDLVGSGDCLRLDRLPSNVTVDESGFLAKITVEA